MYRQFIIQNIYILHSDCFYGLTKLDKGKNQSIRENTGTHFIVKEIKLYKKMWLQHLQRMDTHRLLKQAFNVDRKDEGTRDGRGRVGGPNFILCIKEQDNTANTSGT